MRVTWIIALMLPLMLPLLLSPAVLSDTHLQWHCNGKGSL